MNVYRLQEKHPLVGNLTSYCKFLLHPSVCLLVVVGFLFAQKKIGVNEVSLYYPIY